MIHDTWRRFIEGVDFGPEWNATLARRGRPCTTSARSCRLGLARQAHACTHTTFAPTIMHGGTKTNVIPDLVELEVDIRTLPGQTCGRRPRDARRRARRSGRARRDHAVRRERVDVVADRHAAVGRDGARVVARSSRARRSCRSSRSAPPTPASSGARARSRTASACSAAGSRSRTTPSMFHGNDERVDIESLVLSTQLWEALARDSSTEARSRDRNDFGFRRAGVRNMKHVLRIVAASVFVGAMGVAFAAPAMAVPPSRTPSEPTGLGTVPAGIACTFPISIDLVSGDEGHDFTFFDKNGDVVRQMGTARARRCGRSPTSTRVFRIRSNSPADTFDSRRRRMARQRS